MGRASFVRDSFRTGGQFAAGRRAFLAKNCEGALGHFQKVVDKSPGYVFESVNFRQSVWTYLGRCQYHLGKFAEARYSLEHAVTLHGDDNLARIFFGLTLACDGDDASGFRELERGLKGLHDWIQYENDSNPFKSFWDPNQEIRKEIVDALAMISGKTPDRQKLIECAEWIGEKMEEEIDEVRRQESRPEA
jgi:hypothetical protein